MKIAPGRSRIRVIFDNVQSSIRLNVNKSEIHENTGSRTYVASNTTSICSWANYSIKIRLEIQNYYWLLCCSLGLILEKSKRVHWMTDDASIWRAARVESVSHTRSREFTQNSSFLCTEQMMCIPSIKSLDRFHIKLSPHLNSNSRIKCLCERNELKLFLAHFKSTKIYLIFVWKMNQSSLRSL